jgi:hypothetical protein
MFVAIVAGPMACSIVGPMSEAMLLGGFPNGFPQVGRAAGYAMFFGILGAVGSLIFGLPATATLVRIGWTSFSAFILAGGFTGVVLLALVSAMFPELAGLRLAGTVMIFSLVYAVLFFGTARWLAKDLDSRTSLVAAKQ